jgi:hypothetical protein
VKKLTILAAAAAIASVAPASAQSNTASDSATASITLLQPMKVTKNADLAFGTVVKPSTGLGSVSVSPAAAAVRTPSGGVVALASPVFSAAKFTVEGEGNQSVNINIPATVVLDGPPGATLTLTTTTNLATPAATVLTGSLGATGNAIVYVGGSIPIDSSATTGAYSKAFTVTATYN